MDDREIWVRVEQFRRMKPGYYSALLGLAHISKRSVKLFTQGRPRSLGMLMREKLTRAFRLIDSDQVEFIYTQDINPETGRFHVGRRKMVVAFRPKPAIEVKAPMRYANEILKGQSSGHSHLSLPPLPVRSRLYR